ncbi:sugar ABC transporter ATP-binding protein [uncultured Jatrophihabitans sp.]|uniref:sugar ABC transporter ATP-binding protein n=1 Tax=uncultured Jatrophihabitans sp. TaxID=1610747 RepID=UPI0035CABD42
MTTPAPSTHVELIDVSKNFGGVQALSKVDLSIARGSVHALVGENGAGKSTLSKIISGRLVTDSGALRVDGKQVSFRSPREALTHNIATIAQELAIVPSLSVAANVFLGAEPAAGTVIQRRELTRRFNELNERAGFNLRGGVLAGSLRIADQQKIEVLRALANGASFIVMDEPTAALSHGDTQRLHELIRSLADSGHTILLISHFLGEVLDLSSTVTILRDGHLVRTSASQDETQTSLIEGMLGRTLGSAFPPKTVAPANAEVVLKVEHVTAPGVDDISLEVRAGEVVVLAGLVGAGRSELAHAIVGASRRKHGVVGIDGKPLMRRSINAARKSGIVLIPESRKEQGLLLGRSIRENTTLPSLDTHSVGSWIRRGHENRTTAKVLRDVTIVGASPEQPVGSLSGGNQQKVMFARALLCSPKVLIADEPTRGVDVGSRRAIYNLIVEQAEEGVATLIISSDLEEVLGLAHRVVVLRAGRVVAELSGDDMTEQNVLAAAFIEGGPPLNGPESHEAESHEATAHA